MIGFLIKIAVFLVALLLAYNYFFGTEAEKAQSTKVFSQIKDVAVSVGDLAKSEKDKFDTGKYDTALEKLGTAYKSAREGAQYLDANLLKRFGELEQRKDKLGQELASIEKEDQALSSKAKSGAKVSKAEAAKEAEQVKRKEALHKELESLLNDSNALLKEAQTK